MRETEYLNLIIIVEEEIIMTNERKAEIFDIFAQFIFETLDAHCKTDEEIKEAFLDLGMTEEEYNQEIEL